MANTLLSVFRNCSSANSLSRLANLGFPLISVQNVRCIYAKATLGLDGFQQQQQRIKQQMSNISEKFREKMTEYASDDSKNMIFTEDLKNMIHLSETDKDIELVINMVKRFNTQNKALRFGNYIFGPVIMRMFYIHNKADLALECFKSDEFSGIFDQFITYQILMDLLFENQKYNEMLEVTNIIQEKQIQGAKYPKNVVVLAMAACYKLNTKESLEYALQLWSKLQEVGHQPMRRATTFFAALALNQGRPDVAIEILSSSKNQNYTTVRNIKISALCDLGRLEDILPVLRKVLREDFPEDHSSVQTFNKEIFDKVKAAIVASENPELTLEFNRLEQIFQRQGNVVDTLLDEQLCCEIQTPPRMSNRDFQRNPQFQNRRDSNDNFQRRVQNFVRRPGLTDRV